MSAALSTVTALGCLRAWLARLSPRKRRALAKRRLEMLLRNAGLSKSQATRISHDYWRRDR